MTRRFKGPQLRWGWGRSLSVSHRQDNPPPPKKTHKKPPPQKKSIKIPPKILLRTPQIIINRFERESLRFSHFIVLIKEEVCGKKIKIKSTFKFEKII